MDPNELVEVYSASDANNAEIVRNGLLAEGIKCEIDGEHQGGLAGLSTFEIRLLVRAEDFDRARAYVVGHEPHE